MSLSYSFLKQFKNAPPDNYRGYVNGLVINDYKGKFPIQKTSYVINRTFSKRMLTTKQSAQEQTDNTILLWSVVNKQFLIQKKTRKKNPMKLGCVSCITTRNYKIFWNVCNIVFLCWKNWEFPRNKRSRKLPVHLPQWGNKDCLWEYAMFLNSKLPIVMET